MKRTTTHLWLLVTLMSIGSYALASVTFTPPGGSKAVTMATIKLKAQKAAPKASGTASLICNKGNTKHVFTLEAKGLDPKKVYTVWFVRSVKVKGKTKMEMEGVGKAPYKLKLDAKGNAKLVYSPKDCPAVKKWQQLKIVEHPNKDPKSMKGIIPVLVGDMTKLK